MGAWAREVLLTCTEPNHEQLQDAVSRMRLRLREVDARRSLLARVHRAEEISERLVARHDGCQRRPCAVAVFLPPFEKCHVMRIARSHSVSHACSLGPVGWYRCRTAMKTTQNRLSEGRDTVASTLRSACTRGAIPQAPARVRTQPCQRPKASSKSREVRGVALQAADTGTPRTGKGVCTLTGMSLQNVGQHFATQARLVVCTAAALGGSVSDGVPLLLLRAPLLRIPNGGPRREASSMRYANLSPGMWRCCSGTGAHSIRSARRRAAASPVVPQPCGRTPPCCSPQSCMSARC
jgi:hypothetical protein